MPTPVRRHPRRPQRPVRARAVIAASIVAALVLGGCAASATPPPDPAAPCAGADVQRAAGFYPDLERLVPETLAGVTPTIRDSGRYCSPKMLGPLVDAGHDEVRFAGATFEETRQSGTSLIVYRAPGLAADEVAAAFRVGSGAGRRVQLVSDEPRDVAGRTGRRIELINGDARQVVVVWPARSSDTVDIVIGVDVSNAAIDAAVEALETFVPG
ncbi:MAG: hypothetical protein MUE82_08440 [Chloroflexi bacterium]|nr:hypothetical protein [Chloroflexota bacterium]